MVGTRWRALVLLGLVVALVVAVGSAAAQTGRIGRSQLPVGVPVTDGNQTWTGYQTYNGLSTFNGPITFGPSSNPTTTRQVGYNGTNLGVFESGAFWPFAMVGQIDSGGSTRFHTINFIPSTGVTITRTESPSGQLNYTFSVSATIPAFNGDLNGNALSNSSPLLGGEVVLADPDGVAVHSDFGLNFRGDGGTPDLGRTVHLRGVTTTATATALSLDTGGSTFIPLNTNTTHGYVLTVVGRGVSGTNAGKGFMRSIKALAENTAGTSRLIFATLPGETVADEAGWNATVAVDNTNDVFDVLVTGDTGTTVRWAVRVDETTVTN